MPRKNLLSVTPSLINTTLTVHTNDRILIIEIQAFQTSKVCKVYCMFRTEHIYSFLHLQCQFRMCVCVCQGVCASVGVKLFIWGLCRSRKDRRRETESTAERESESLLPTIPHVAQLPFKHHKQASGVMSRREGRRVVGVGVLSWERKLSANTTATGTNLSHLNYSYTRWIRFPRISH